MDEHGARLGTTTQGRTTPGTPAHDELTGVLVALGCDISGPRAARDLGNGPARTRLTGPSHPHSGTECQNPTVVHAQAKRFN